ncbi:LytTR family transcriptional regulator DNA-binding domain-containing protein [Oceanobacillus kimchii]|uniref:LytTR family transcriptional regulator DNA-binding domain-containing protein n=1 Tax=Oceanobacillus kimchii TaxID=746691 RepID=UPI000345B2EA|nr:LytTR family transcriptional regulator DNA-binding domain-containing protein [Oceanobacillus kimchii]MCT1577474.1 LytTR family transcriptional regulator DNA-binding domain-containing protein [Oceanobacillus kimchii]MCT2137082.1 LytTR family transcriptional regulator DNA-binding domain-containing protein [Oceanobacillus kimchii]
MLQLRELEYRQGDHILFSTFHLTIQEGEVAAIHSSLNVRQMLIKMIVGDKKINNGSIELNGITLEDKVKYFQALGLQLLSNGLYERMNTKEYFRFIEQLYQTKVNHQELIEKLQLHEVKDKPISKLTESEQKRVHYGKTIIQDACIYLFEEPDLNVDLETKRVLVHVLNHLKQNKKGVLILTSNMESAITLAERVYRLNEEGLQTVEIKTEENEEKQEIDEVSEEELGKQDFSFQLNKIPSKVNDKIVLLDPPEIDYIESDEGQAVVHMKGSSFRTAFTLRQLEEKLEHQGFFRCHRSYIVNLQKVREVITWTRNSYSLVLQDKEKTQVPLSKAKLVELKQILGVD